MADWALKADHLPCISSASDMLSETVYTSSRTVCRLKKRKEKKAGDRGERKGGRGRKRKK